MGDRVPEDSDPEIAEALRRSLVEKEHDVDLERAIQASLSASQPSAQASFGESEDALLERAIQESLRIQPAEDQDPQLARALHESSSDVSSTIQEQQMRLLERFQREKDSDRRSVTDGEPWQTVTKRGRAVPLDPNLDQIGSSRKAGAKVEHRGTILGKQDEETNEGAGALTRSSHPPAKETSASCSTVPIQTDGEYLLPGTAGKPIADASGVADNDHGPSSASAWTGKDSHRPHMRETRSATSPATAHSASSKPEAASLTPRPPSTGRMESVSGVVLDGQNVACEYGGGRTSFRSRGIELAIEFFNKRGIEAVAIVPRGRVDERPGRSDLVADDPELLRRLGREGKCYFSPAGAHDDYFIIQYAMAHGRRIVSNDHYREMAGKQVDPENRQRVGDFITRNRIAYMFVGDTFLPAGFGG